MPITPTDEAPLGMPEVAAMLGVAVDTLRYWRHRGEGPPSYKIGRRVRYDAADVRAWKAAERAKSRSDAS